MEPAGPTIVVLGGLGPPQLGLLIGQVRRDLMRVSEVINEFDWMLWSCPPYLRPLAERGFTARMGTGLRDWETAMDALLESLREMDRARLERRFDMFDQHAEAFLADSDRVITPLEAILNGISSLPEEAFSMASENEKELEALALRQAEAVGDLLISLEMLIRLIRQDKSLTSPKRTF